MTGWISMQTTRNEFYFAIDSIRIFSRVKLLKKGTENSSYDKWQLRYKGPSEFPSSIPSSNPSNKPSVAPTGSTVPSTLPTQIPSSGKTPSNLTEWTLALNIDPSDGNRAGWGSDIWYGTSDVGSSENPLSSDFKDYQVWLSEFDCLAIARHNGSTENHTGLKIWRMIERITFSNYFNEGSHHDRLIATSGGPVLIQLADGDTAESVETDPILAYDPSNISLNNLAFNWKYSNNGARVVLTDKGHHSGTLSDIDSNDDSTHGLGNDLGTEWDNYRSDAWYHDASIIQTACHGDSCKTQGTDIGNNLRRTVGKLGSYAFYVSNLEDGKCPAGWPKIPSSAPSTPPLLEIWEQFGTDIDGEKNNDFSGEYISLSSDGSTVAIGSMRHWGPIGEAQGQVRIFRLDSSTTAGWVQMGVAIYGEARVNNFGRSISLSSDGNIVAIGAHTNSAVDYRSGNARIFQFSNGDWIQMGNSIYGDEMCDYSGQSVSMSSNGETVAIGAPGGDYIDGNSKTVYQSGTVRVYRWSVTASDWAQAGADIYGEVEADSSGNFLSMSADGNILAIAANRNGFNGSFRTYRGHVRIFKWSTSDWIQMGEDIDGEGNSDYSGASLAMSSDGLTVAIGARGNDNDNGLDSGHVRIYQWSESTSSWIQVGQDIDGERAKDESGHSVSLSADGKIVAIGSIENYGSTQEAFDYFRYSGQVRIYQLLSNSVWTQMGEDIYGENRGDMFGSSVSLSADGKIVAIGARRNDSNNVNDKGHVRLYKWK